MRIDPGLFSFKNSHFISLTVSLGFEAKYWIALAIVVYPTSIHHFFTESTLRQKRIRCYDFTADIKRFKDLC